MAILRNLQVTGSPGHHHDTPFAITDQRGLYNHVVSLGDVKEWADGRKFRMMKYGGTVTVTDALVAVPNVQAVAATYVGADSSTAPVSGEGGSIGDETVRLTDDVTGVTKDEYQGGTMHVIAGTGLGYSYKIKSHAATGSAGTGFLVKLWDPIQVALDNTSVLQLVASKYNAVVVHTAADPNTQHPVGIAVKPGSANDYAWVQVKGDVVVQADTGGVAAGQPVTLGEATNGSVREAVYVDASSTIGRARAAITATEYGVIELNLE